MLISELKSQIIPLHFSYNVVFDDRGTKHTKFSVSVLRGLLPGPLPVKLPFDNYTRPKFEQFMLLSTSDNEITIGEVLSEQTSPPTDLELVFEVNSSSRFIPIVMLINDDDRTIEFYN